MSRAVVVFEMTDKETTQDFQEKVHQVLDKVRELEDPPVANVYLAIEEAADRVVGEFQKGMENHA